MLLTSEPTGSKTRRSSRARRADGGLKEIQALRALAVAIVVVYHFWPEALPGGFVGVDVFFVISGFLIGSHLLREIASTGTVSLTRFWARRIRRILPAAIIVLLAALAILLFALPSTTWPNTFAQIGASSVYVVNWVLASQSVDYLAADNAPTIVQHFWSLSVEEQFYIVLPIVMVVVLLVARLTTRRRPAMPGALRLLAIVVSVLTVASFVYSWQVTIYAPSLAYFDTFARAWEFGLGVSVGALAVIAPRAFEAIRSHPVWGRSRALTFVGLALIMAGAWTSDADSHFPAPGALVPVLGALAVIAGGFSPRGIGRVLGTRPVQFLGDISYSTYLWHWLAITWFIAAMGHAPGFLGGVSLVAATLVAASITKTVIEDPFRKARLFAVRRWPAYLLAAGSAAVVIALVTTLSAVTAPRAPVAPDASQQGGCYGAASLLSGDDCGDPFAYEPSIDTASASADLDTEHWCLTWYDQDWLTCEVGDTSENAQGVIALVGDSYAASYTVAMDEYFSRNGWKVETFTRFGCSGLGLPNPDVDTSDLYAQEYTNCRTWSERVREEIAQRDDISAVVYINRPPGRPADGERYALSPDDVKSTWTQMLDAGKKVIDVRTSPDLGLGNIPTCVESARGDIAQCARPRGDVVVWAPEDDARQAMGERVKYIDLTDAFCDPQTCASVVGNVVVFADDRHVSTSYARSVLEFLGPRIVDVLNE